jgi:bacteriocin-like protein
MIEIPEEELKKVSGGAYNPEDPFPDLKDPRTN